METKQISAYPLQWPEGWKRTVYRNKSKFKIVSFETARRELSAELARMRVKDIILSTNVPLRQDGYPYANRNRLPDPGVAVYFKYKGKGMAFACDTWRTIEENIIAITRTIEAIRGIERWGASDMMERAFTGFARLEAPLATEQWWDILQCRPDSSVETIKAQYRRLSKDHHPDNGGTHEQMAKINHAYDRAMSS